jgi:hypothetical protein
MHGGSEAGRALAGSGGEDAEGESGQANCPEDSGQTAQRRWACAWA